MSDNKQKKCGAYSELKGFNRALPIILAALAIFIAVCFMTKNTGALGRGISEFLLGSFSIGAYFFPALMIIHAFFYPSDVKKKKVLISRIIFSFVLIITVSVLTHAIANFGKELSYSASALYSDGKENVGGGFIGGTVAYAIIKMIDYVGLVILSITVFALYVVYFLAGENNAVKGFFKKTIYRVVDACARAEENFKTKKAEKEERIKRKKEEAIKSKEPRRQALTDKEDELFEDEFFAVDNGLKELRIKELGINEKRTDADIEKNPTLQEKVHPRSAVNKTDEANETFSEPQRRKFSADYGVNSDSDIIIENPYSDSPKSAYSYDASESADAFFAKDFNPYNLRENERLANKPSSRAAFDRKADVDVTEIKSAERERKVFTERELEEARRRARFDLRREQLIKEEAERKAAEEAKTREENERRATEEAERIRLEELERERLADEERQRETALREEVERKAREEANRIVFSEPIAEVYENPAPVSEPIEEEVPVFKSFPTAERELYRAENDITDEDTIKITRSVMTDADESDDDDEDDGTLCVFEDDEDDLDGDEEAEESEEFDFTVENEEDSAPEIEEPIPPEKQNPDVLKFRELYNSNIFSEPTPASVAVKFDSDDDEEETLEEEKVEEPEEDDVPFDDYMPIHSPVIAESKKAEQEKPAAEKPDYSAFKFPPIDLLAKGKDSEDPTIELEIQENGEKLIDALAQFNVRASVRSVDRGPRITRYEIVPARGVRVNSVISLFDDIALNLAAEGIRMEAPIPGKSAIGVEIPNKHPTTVMLRDLLETEEFKNESSKTFSCVGMDVTGNPVFGDMSKMPHILVAGATGMGKSVCINSILISILYKARPDEVKFIMIDPKTVEFTMYNGIPHLLVPVVTDVKQAAGALMWAIDEMNRRYELMAKHEVRKLDSYNDLVRENPELGEPLPKIIIVIDELNDLMQQVRKPVEGLITNITQKARAAGIHMIIGTQRPSVDVITGVIKANVPSRISCKVTSFNDSKTILDQAGAEKLLDKGDMLYAPVGKPKPVRVQGAFVSDSEVEKIMKFLKSNVKGAVYDEQAMEGINRATQKCVKGSKDSGFDDDFDTDDSESGGGGYLNDKQFLEAADLAVKQGKISTSLIQRKIGVGYGKAAKFIDIMEELGIVSEPNGQKPRDVLVTRDEWREMLSRREID